MKHTQAIFFESLLQNAAAFTRVVNFDAGRDRLLLLDFTAANTELDAALLADTALFTRYVQEKLAAAQCRYGIGGYNEHRAIYARSNLFQGAASAADRCIHLGIDIWAPAGTPVYAPCNATVHSFAFNDQFGDYGPTIILQHETEGVIWHSLYGHLSLADLQNLQPGRPVAKGALLAHFGAMEENGHWPPHLHFQLILDMEGKAGDYPGVCTLQERERYLNNCPNPDLVLDMMRYATASGHRL